MSAIILHRIDPCEEYAPVLQAGRAARSIRAMVLYPGVGTHRPRRASPHGSLCHRHGSEALVQQRRMKERGYYYAPI